MKDKWCDNLEVGDIVITELGVYGGISCWWDTYEHPILLLTKPLPISDSPDAYRVATVLCNSKIIENYWDGDVKCRTL